MTSDVVRVLVVDDHALHREGTRRIFESDPTLEVVGDASSAETALALVDSLRPDVVLMDIRLPGMNGIEATRHIRERHPAVRVLVVSAYDDREYLQGALEAGASGYLTKTAPGREFVQAVRTVAAGGTVLEPGMLALLLTREENLQAPAGKTSPLTEREASVLQLLAEGLQNKQVAVRLGISPRTVERHCDSIYAKLGARSRTDAVVKALAAGLLDSAHARR